MLGCFQYLLERLAIIKYETNGTLVQVTIEVVVPSDLSSNIYILCKVSLTRSYESKAAFAVNHNAILFSLSEDEAHSQKIKTGEEEQPQTSYSSRFCKILAKTNFISPISHCMKLDYEQKMFQSDKKFARHRTKYHDHTQPYSDGLNMCFYSF